MRLGLLLGCCLFGGCYPLGTGDADLASEIVYSPEGQPAFAGQALMIESCGAGQYCHASAATGPNRYGVPRGLTFDLRPASYTSEVLPVETSQLLNDHVRSFNMRAQIWEQVASGRMPIDGTVGAEYGENTDHIQWHRFEDDGLTFSDLPELDTPEGREILRNWLAAGLPVAERTEARRDRQPNATGYTVPVCERDCVDPTWGSVYREILVPSCTSSRCHDNDDPEAELDLTLGEAETYDHIVSQFARGNRCAPTVVQAHFGRRYLIVPGAPDESVLYQKLAASSGNDVCGSIMPLGGVRLTTQRLCAIRVWIECGACLDASDERCLECTRSGRMQEECNVALANDTNDDGICQEGTLCCDGDGDDECDPEEACSSSARCCDADGDGTCGMDEMCCDPVCAEQLPCPNRLAP